MGLYTTLLPNVVAPERIRMIAVINVSSVTYMSHSRFALLGSGVRVQVGIREQRKIKGRSKALLTL